MLVVQADDVEPHLRWVDLARAIEQGHRFPKAKISDSFLTRSDQTLLLRSAWIDGLGMAVKVATIFPGNTRQQLPSVQGSVTLYDDAYGSLEAMVDFDLVTRYKTVGDSFLAASKLARPDCEHVLIVGAGRIAATALSAYQVMFPDASFEVWNHRQSSAEQLADRLDRVSVAVDLETAVRKADLVSCATLSKQPLIQGAWLKPGQHIDLIGAYRADMREADDAVLLRGRLFVDNRETTIGHIGELKIPMAQAVIDASAVVADFYDISEGLFARQTADEITVFKNGGGAHLDLMTARHMVLLHQSHIRK